MQPAYKGEGRGGVRKRDWGKTKKKTEEWGGGGGGGKKGTSAMKTSIDSLLRSLTAAKF